MRPPAARRRALAAALLACLALAGTGCGGDEEHRATATETTDSAPTGPPRTAPPATVRTEPPRTITVPPTKTTPGGGADAPGNDTAPPKGSPQERFERRCAKSPETCR